MLDNQDCYSEEAWQKKLLGILKLIFPKYISVLSKIQINGKKQLDYLLIDANGYVDVIEIKKPSKNSLLYQKQYRNNFAPLKDLSGSVMQTEKYIFYLSRWGENGEKTLNSKYRDKLPEGLKIKIINPKGIIIIGRENDLSPEQKQDFEFIKRQYKNMIEIITYDSLIGRIKRVISSFSIGLSA